MKTLSLLVLTTFIFLTTNACKERVHTNATKALSSEGVRAEQLLTRAMKTDTSRSQAFHADGTLAEARHYIDLVAAHFDLTSSDFYSMFYATNMVDAKGTLEFKGGVASFPDAETESRLAQILIKGNVGLYYLKSQAKSKRIQAFINDKQEIPREFRDSGMTQLIFPSFENCNKLATRYYHAVFTDPAFQFEHATRVAAEITTKISAIEPVDSLLTDPYPDYKQLQILATSLDLMLEALGLDKAAPVKLTASQKVLAKKLLVLKATDMGRKLLTFEPAIDAIGLPGESKTVSPLHSAVTTQTLFDHLEQIEWNGIERQLFIKKVIETTIALEIQGFETSAQKLWEALGRSPIPPMWENLDVVRLDALIGKEEIARNSRHILVAERYAELIFRTVESLPKRNLETTTIHDLAPGVMAAMLASEKNTSRSLAALEILYRSFKPQEKAELNAHLVAMNDAGLVKNLRTTLASTENLSRDFIVHRVDSLQESLRRIDQAEQRALKTTVFGSEIITTRNLDKSEILQQISELYALAKALETNDKNTQELLKRVKSNFNWVKKLRKNVRRSSTLK